MLTAVRALCMSTALGLCSSAMGCRATPPPVAPPRPSAPVPVTPPVTAPEAPPVYSTELPLSDPKEQEPDPPAPAGQKSDTLLLRFRGHDVECKRAKQRVTPDQVKIDSTIRHRSRVILSQGPSNKEILLGCLPFRAIGLLMRAVRAHIPNPYLGVSQDESIEVTSCAHLPEQAGWGVKVSYYRDHDAHAIRDKSSFQFSRIVFTENLDDVLDVCWTEEFDCEDSPLC